MEVRVRGWGCRGEERSGGVEVGVKEVEKQGVEVGRCGGKSQAGEAEETVNQEKIFLPSKQQRQTTPNISVHNTADWRQSSCCSVRG